MGHSSRLRMKVQQSPWWHWRQRCSIPCVWTVFVSLTVLRQKEQDTVLAPAATAAAAGTEDDTCNIPGRVQVIAMVEKDDSQEQNAADILKNEMVQHLEH